MNPLCPSGAGRCTIIIIAPFDLLVSAHTLITERLRGVNPAQWMYEAERRLRFAIEHQERKALWMQLALKLFRGNANSLEDELVDRARGYLLDALGAAA